MRLKDFRDEFGKCENFGDCIKVCQKYTPGGFLIRIDLNGNNREPSVSLHEWTDDENLIFRFEPGRTGEYQHPEYRMRECVERAYSYME